MNSKAFIPEVRFELSPIEMEAELLYSFSKPKHRFSSVMYRIFPGLADIISGSLNKEDAIHQCGIFAENVIERDKDLMIKAMDSTQKEWNLISRQYLELLSEHFETGWPEDRAVITGYVSIMPIFPRFLSTFSFCVGYRPSKLKNMEVIAHETLHFLWFKKWSEVFPLIPSDQYNSPHLVWRLSEIMAPIVLHFHSEIKRLIQPETWNYDSLKTIKIGNISILDYFTHIYLDCVKKDQSFDTILEILWREAQEHRDAILRF